MIAYFIFFIYKENSNNNLKKVTVDGNEATLSTTEKDTYEYTLDKKTNEMLIKNARNTVEQSKMTAKLASGSSVKIETLETTWRTIMNGIDETKNIQETARKQRIDDAARLENIKKEFLETYGGTRTK